jgi:hypothetical protein
MLSNFGEEHNKTTHRARTPQGAQEANHNIIHDGQENNRSALNSRGCTEVAAKIGSNSGAIRKQRQEISDKVGSQPGHVTRSPREVKEEENQTLQPTTDWSAVSIPERPAIISARERIAADPSLRSRLYQTNTQQQQLQTLKQQSAAMPAYARKTSDLRTNAGGLRQYTGTTQLMM